MSLYSTPLSQFRLRCVRQPQSPPDSPDPTNNEMPAEEAGTHESAGSINGDEPDSLADVDGSYDQYTQEEENVMDSEGSSYQESMSSDSDDGVLTEVKVEPESESDDGDDVPLMQRLGKATDAPNGSTAASVASDHGNANSGIQEEVLVPGDDDEHAQSGKQAEDERDSDINMEPANPISWKLPEYEALYELTPEDFPLAKISLPGLVRHPIFLSPDHSEAEFRLFTHVFLPAQRTLNPRSSLEETKLDILNFHTIAVLILDTLQIHGKLANSKKMDVDEVFLSCMDNWRIGREAGRGNYEAVRGVQEFFDVGWELVWYVKEHGLGTEVEEKKEKGKKGSKSGKAIKGAKGGAKGAGKATAKVLQGRKTVKTPTAEKTKTPTAEKTKTPTARKTKIPASVKARTAAAAKKPKVTGRTQGKVPASKQVKPKEKTVQSGRVTKSRAKK